MRWGWCLADQRTGWVKISFVDPSIIAVLESGGLIGVLVIAVTYLNRRNDQLSLRIENRYDAELCIVRRRQEECERDREDLHREIAAILKDDE
jgi:hypothetical protein